MNISMLMKTIKLVTLDCTNTLLKFRQPAWIYYASSAEKFGYKVDHDYLKTEFSKAFKDMWVLHKNFGAHSIGWQNWWLEVVVKSFGDQIPKPDVELLAQQLIEDFTTPKCWCAVDGSYELLENFKKCNLSLGVISNFDPRLHAILDNFKMREYFDFILTSYEAGYYKPEKEIFNKALYLSKIPTNSEKALHIGDDFIKDYKGAKSAGWNAIIINEDTHMYTNAAEKYTSVQKLLEALKSNLK